MTRQQAHDFTREQLNAHGLNEWKIRVTADPNLPFLGLCMHNDKVIMLNGHHIDIHPYVEVVNTIRHEVAHAIVGPGNGHNEVWATKAREIGCDNTEPCSRLDIPAHVIDAIRSGHSVEVEVTETEVVQKIRNVKHVITRLQDKCPTCGKVAVERFAVMGVDKQGNQVKMITLDCFHIIQKVIPKATPFESMVSNFWKPEVAACFHKWNKNQCELCGEFRLFDFQVLGARFAEAGLAMGKGVLIADDMGLGKTVQALAIIKYHAKRYKKTMVVTKSSIKFQWLKQALRWLGPDFLGQIISTSRDFLMPNLRLYIIPYDLLRRFPREKLHALGIDLIILDECQQIKNPDSSRTQEVRKLVTAKADTKVIELSGTPWNNRGCELFPAMNLIDPLKFHSYQHFLDTWVEYFWKGAKKKMGGIRNIPKFKEYTENLIIRREYNEVMDEYPEVNRVKLNVQLDEISQSTYDDATSDFVAWYNEHVIGGTEDSISGIELLAQMSRMRHITGLAKIPATLGFVEEFVEETERKLTIFVHHKDVGLLLHSGLTNTDKASNPDFYELAQTCKDERIRVLRFTSDLSAEERHEVQTIFNDSKRAILIASTRACGEGVDLQTCSDSVLHERQWNPGSEDQATPGRFRRIGQVSKVINITCTEGEGTIDEYLDDTVEGKRHRFHAVHNKGEVPKWSQDDFARELAQTIVKKYQEKQKKQGKPKLVKGASVTAMASF